MKRVIIAFILLCFAIVAFAAPPTVFNPFTGRLDYYNIDKDTECNQAKYYNNVLCIDTDDDKLYKGTGAAVVEITSGGAGDTIAPATNTDSYVPQWNGANSKTLKDGLATDGSGDCTSGAVCLGDHGHSSYSLKAGETWTGTHDFGGATVELPNSDTLPGTCTVGQTYIDIDATSTQRLYVCESTNTWVAQKGDAGATGPAPAGQIFLSAAGMWPSTTSGAATNTLNETSTNDVNYWSLDYDASTAECAEATVVMPSDWNAGTVTAVPYWSHGATTTNFGVVFSVACRAFANDDALDQAYGTVQTSTDTGGTTGDLYIGPATSAITCAGTPAANQLVQFRVCRVAADGSDTLAIDAKLLGAMIGFTRQ